MAGVGGVRLKRIAALATAALLLVAYPGGEVGATDTCAPGPVTAQSMMAVVPADLRDEVEALRDGATQDELARLEADARRTPEQLECSARAVVAQLTQEGGLQAPLLGLAALLGYPNSAVLYSRPLPAAEPLAAAVLEAYKVHGVTPSAGEVLALRTGAAQVPTEYQRAIAVLVFAVADAKLMWDAATAAVSAAERQEILDLQPAVEGARDAALARGGYDQAYFDDPAVSRLGELAGQIDWGTMLAAALTLAAAVERVEGMLPSAPAPLIDFVDPYQFVEARGQGDSDLALPALVTFDGDGNDRYSGPVGAATPLSGGHPVALAFDAGGNDRYTATTTSQGAGVFGIGMLVDEGNGRDRYVAESGAQGWGDTGIGVLIDEGGSDRYEVGVRGQGAAHEGIGALVDYGAEKDVYAGQTDVQATSFADTAQRLHTAGLLRDDGGNDVYAGEFSAQAQAAASSSVLLDRGGNDLYQASGASQARNCSGLALILDEGGRDSMASGQSSQALSTCAGGLSGLFAYGPEDDAYRLTRDEGQARVFSGGSAILYEEGGSDVYAAGNQTQGSSVGATSFALLYDRAGDDSYGGRSNSHGYGQSFGQGILLDREGNDVYNSTGTFAQGAGNFPGGLGLLLDRLGDDSYRAITFGQGVGKGGASGALVEVDGTDSYVGQEKVQGYGEGTLVPAGLGLLLDSMGGDVYAGSLGANDAAWRQGTVGVGFDTRIFIV